MTWFQHKVIQIDTPEKLRVLLGRYVLDNGKVSSQREAKRLIKGKGVHIDNVGQVEDAEFVVDRTMRVRIGKRRVYDFVMEQ